MVKKMKDKMYGLWLEVSKSHVVWTRENTRKTSAVLALFCGK